MDPVDLSGVTELSPHPLLLPPVLEALFKFTHCDNAAIRTSRLVCKSWLTIATAAFKRRSVLSFLDMSPETYAQVYKSLEDNTTFLPVNIALTLSPSGEDVPDSNRPVCPWKVCEECIFPYGASIESLKFYAWDTVSEQLNATLFAQVLQTPSRLMSLEVSLLPKEVRSSPLFPRPWTCIPPLAYLTQLVMYGKMNQCQPEFFQNFLSSMPNVVSISINYCSQDFLDKFTAALTEVTLKTLQELKLNHVFILEGSHVLNIEAAKLRLRTAHIAQDKKPIGFHEYESLLPQLVPTLEDARLTCCVRESSPELFIRMPFMPNLKRLHLHCVNFFQIWNINFIKNTPNLEVLVMEQKLLAIPNWNVWYCFTEEWEIEPHTCLKELTLPAVPFECYIHLESLSNILSKFTALQKLTISANDALLECLFQTSVHLVELNIDLYSTITDEGITGLVKGRWVNETPNCNVKWGITALKDLKKLSINANQGSVGDFSVKHGIMHLEKLESLVLAGCFFGRHETKLALRKPKVTVVTVAGMFIYEPGEIVCHRVPFEEP